MRFFKGSIILPVKKFKNFILIVKNEITKKVLYYMQDLGIHRYFLLTLYILEHLDTWKHGFLDTWILGNLVTLILGYLNT